MHVHMMITHHARSARGRPLQRAGAASRSRVRSLVGFGDKDLDEVVACSIEGPEVQREVYATTHLLPYHTMSLQRGSPCAGPKTKETPTRSAKIAISAGSASSSSVRTGNCTRGEMR